MSCTPDPLLRCWPVLKGQDTVYATLGYTYGIQTHWLMKRQLPKTNLSFMNTACVCFNSRVIFSTYWSSKKVKYILIIFRRIFSELTILLMKIHRLFPKTTKDTSHLLFSNTSSRTVLVGTHSSQKHSVLFKRYNGRDVFLHWRETDSGDAISSPFSELLVKTKFYWVLSPMLDTSAQTVILRCFNGQQISSLSTFFFESNYY